MTVSPKIQNLKNENLIVKTSLDPNLAIVLKCGLYIRYFWITLRTKKLGAEKLGKHAVPKFSHSNFCDPKFWLINF